MKTWPPENLPYDDSGGRGESSPELRVKINQIQILAPVPISGLIKMIKEI